MNHFKYALTIAIANLVSLSVLAGDAAGPAQMLEQMSLERLELELLRTQAQNVAQHLWRNTAIARIGTAWGQPDVVPESTDRSVCYELAELVERTSSFILHSPPKTGGWRQDDLREVLISLAQINSFCGGFSPPAYGLSGLIEAVLKPGERMNVPTPRTAKDLGAALNDLALAMTSQLNRPDGSRKMK